MAAGQLGARAGVNAAGVPLARAAAAVAAVACVLASASAAGAQVNRTTGRARLAPSSRPPTVVCRVDPAVELFSVIQLLAAQARGAAPEAVPAFDHAYRREVLAHFAPFATHPAVQTAARLVDPGATHVAATLGSRLTPPPALRARAPLGALSEGPDSLGAASVRRLVAEARDLARAAAFDRFFAEHGAFYDRLCARVLAGDEPGEAARAAASFYGPAPGGYVVVLMPLVPFTGVAPTLSSGAAPRTLTAFVGPAGVANDEPRFRTGWGLSRVLLHEFSHQHVNPAVAAAAPRLARSARLLEPARGRLWRADRVSTWTAAVTETTVRAAVAVMRGEMAGDTAMQAELREHRALGFVFVDSVATELKAWKSAARPRPFTASVSRRLTALFDRLAASSATAALFDPPFEGGMINALRGRESDSLIFIVPTAEADRELQDSLHARMRARAERYASALVLTDQEALARDLRTHTLWAVGTPDGNLWLRSHPGVVPARVLGDRIEADSQYVGRGLVFLTAVPNPGNPSRALLLTVGQRVDELARGWWLLAADYAVVDGERVLVRGTYVKQGAAWRFPATPPPRAAPPAPVR